MIDYRATKKLSAFSKTLGVFLPIFDHFSSHVQNHQGSLLLIYPYNPFF